VRATGTSTLPVTANPSDARRAKPGRTPARDDVGRSPPATGAGFCIEAGALHKMWHKRQLRAPFPHNPLRVARIGNR
jgi:hypothetical protein